MELRRPAAILAPIREKRAARAAGQAGHRRTCVRIDRFRGPRCATAHRPGGVPGCPIPNRGFFRLFPPSFPPKQPASVLWVRSQVVVDEVVQQFLDGYP
jgi:hypothetical protein